MKVCCVAAVLIQSVFGLLRVSVTVLYTNQGVSFCCCNGMLRTPYFLHAVAVADLQTELNAEGLGLCHGILHASGVSQASFRLKDVDA